MKYRGFAATATLLLLLCSQALGARHLAAQTPLPEEIETCCEALAAIGFTSELPVFILDTLGHNVTTKGKNVDVTWCTCPMGNKAYKAQNGTAVASVHGNSSAKFAKKYVEGNFEGVVGYVCMFSWWVGGQWCRPTHGGVLPFHGSCWVVQGAHCLGAVSRFLLMSHLHLVYHD